MKRRTLDIIFVVGGVAMAALMAVLGLVLKANADFAKDYVKDQLSEQQITFTKTEFLTPAAKWNEDVLALFGGDQAKADAFKADKKIVAEADSKCLTKYAGQLMTSGKMAECYANDYIRLHLADGSVVDGKSYTYSTIGGLQRELRTQIADLTAKNDPTLPDVQARLDKVNATRETLFKGESLRGLLLTSYGFSIFGEKAMLAATVCFLLGLVLLLASLAGLIHALKTPKTELVGHHGETPATA